ncbi:response regulator [Breoghania sp.]|uniref:hybrid sensor histidine kinase/response regulator n=1 Tax=Breoghania sp. TaxID=2065378 RepID=UPI0029C9AE4A|nr:response regulator [Breoghania sp.]
MDAAALPTYRQNLFRKLFGIPVNLSIRYHRYFIASNFMFVFALVGHSAFIPIFWILGAAHVFFYNILCVILDAFCLFLNHRRRHALAFGLWVTEVAFHASLCTLAYGWDSGFQYYILSLTVFVFIAPWKKTINILSLCVLMGIYLALNIHFQTASSSHPLYPFMENSADIINIVVNFVVLGYMAYHYSRASEKAQQALEQSEKELKTTLAASPVGIALVKDRKTQWSNETMRSMLGFAPEDPIDPDILNFFPDIAKVDRIEKMVFKDGQSSTDLPDTYIVRKDGVHLPCQIKIRPMTPKDATQGAIVAVMDISELKAAENEKQELQAKIQRSEKMEAIGTLAGGVAHDLNNILSGVMSYPELLLMDLPQDSSMRQPLETIKKSGEKAAAIVKDLLTLARRGVPTRQVADLNAVVTEYLGSPEHAELARYHPGVRFAAVLDPNLSAVSGAVAQLGKTVMNLVSNAAESISEGGTVTIETRNCVLCSAYTGYELIEAGAYAVLSVSDTGQGMSTKDMERIFEPFFTKKVMGRSGTGLGLAVVWGTAKDNGGYVDVVSQPGQGARFDLYLPTSQELAVHDREDEAVEKFMGNGEHVLVVDDVGEQRLVATGMLKKLGYRTDAVASGEAAIAWMADNQSDLLILDMIMDPGIDGLETYRRILKTHPKQRAVIASGYSETQRVAQALELGAACYLKKPYTLLEMAKTVKKALR